MALENNPTDIWPCCEVLMDPVEISAIIEESHQEVQGRMPTMFTRSCPHCGSRLAVLRLKEREGRKRIGMMAFPRRLLVRTGV